MVLVLLWLLVFLFGFYLMASPPWIVVLWDYRTDGFLGFVAFIVGLCGTTAAIARLALMKSQ